MPKEMTKDDILKMPAGREMDALIFTEFMYQIHWELNGHKYSTDIAAAWQVAEKMASSGYYFVLDYDLCAWTAKFTSVDSGKTTAVNTTKSNAAEEICRAALLAVMK